MCALNYHGHGHDCRCDRRRRRHRQDLGCGCGDLSAVQHADSSQHRVPGRHSSGHLLEHVRVSVRLYVCLSGSLARCLLAFLCTRMHAHAPLFQSQRILCSPSTGLVIALLRCFSLRYVALHAQVHASVLLADRGARLSTRTNGQRRWMYSLSGRLPVHGAHRHLSARVLVCSCMHVCVCLFVRWRWSVLHG